MPAHLTLRRRVCLAFYRKLQTLQPARLEARLDLDHAGWSAGGRKPSIELVHQESSLQIQWPVTCAAGSFQNPAMVRVQDVNPPGKMGVKCSKECFHPRGSRGVWKKASTSTNLLRDHLTGEMGKGVRVKSKTSLSSLFPPSFSLILLSSWMGGV